MLGHFYTNASLLLDRYKECLNSFFQVKAETRFSKTATWFKSLETSTIYIFFFITIVFDVCYASADLESKKQLKSSGRLCRQPIAKAARV